MDLHMKLGDNGEAFFVEENESMVVRLACKCVFVFLKFVTVQLFEVCCLLIVAVNVSPQLQVPAHLCTSPLPLEIPEETAEASEGSFIAGSGTRRKKRRRKRMRSENHLREDASSSSDERQREKEEWDRESDQAGQETPAQEEDVAALQMRSVIKTHTVPLN